MKVNRKPSAFRTTALAAAWCCGFCFSAWGANLPSGFTETLLLADLNNPTQMEFTPDGRLFICQQNGAIRIYKNGALLPTPFAAVEAETRYERGLLGIAVDPQFASNKFVYVFYTAASPYIHNRISRFTALGDLADPAAGETVLLDLDPLTASGNHNGGGLHFGTDGCLYLAHGDNENSLLSQSLDNLSGKMLRMHPTPDPVQQIPLDNPFLSATTGKNRLIWCRGLRNPFGFAVQPGTGKMLINDVGNQTWEEINEAGAGRNFGWPVTEGTFNVTTYPEFTPPVFSYPHSGGSQMNGNAITGGTFYNPAAPTFPAPYRGKYFFSDFRRGWIYFLDPANPGSATEFLGWAGSLSQLNIVDLKVGQDGALYVLARALSASSLRRFQYETTGTPPNILLQPASKLVSLGEAAQFTVSASGSLPFSYQWQRDGVPISGATYYVYNTPATSLTDNGAAFRCAVSNAYGSVTSSSATLTVTSNKRPTPTINVPAAGSSYSAGTQLNFSGSGADPEDGALPASAFTWRIEFHHMDHTHLSMPNTSGITSGSFAIPNRGEASDSVYYEVFLTVTDSGGLSSSTSRVVWPNTATLQLNTQPAGLQVTLDGQPANAPFQITGVTGMLRTLGVVSPQRVGGKKFVFVSWSDGGAASHEITTPANATVYTANFREIRSKDFTGDGKDDLLLRHPSNGQVSLWIFN